MLLIGEINRRCLELVQDAFGNYVVQYVLDLELEQTISDVADKLVTEIHVLSTQKFSSNVIEKVSYF